MTEQIQVATPRLRHQRVPDGLEAAARSAAPELAELEWSTLVRAGLARLAGHGLAEAITLGRRLSWAPPGDGPR